MPNETQQDLHIVGPKGEAAPARGPEGPPYVIENYVDRMDLAYAAADMVIVCPGVT